MSSGIPLAASCWQNWKLIRFKPPIDDCCQVLGRVKGLVLAMLVSLRVAPVPLRAFDPPSAPGAW